MGLENDSQRRFLLVHEAWHIGLMDIIRGKGKNQNVFNQACDHYINLMVDAEDDKLLEFIPKGLKDKKFTGWEKEDIYNELMKNPTENGGSMSGDVMPNPDLTPEQQQQLEDAISSIVQQSAMQTRMAGGKVPDQVEKYLDELYNPRIPWERLLIKYTTATAKNNYSYQRVNKSVFAHGIILPTLFSKGLGHIAIANDSSGSVSEKEFSTYLGAIKHIKDKLKPTKMSVINFTTRITNKWEVQKHEDINKIQFRATGGTDLKPVFEHFNKKENKPKVLIVFSDLECEPITKKPDYDVIWICVNNKQAKTYFGRTIHIEA